MPLPTISPLPEAPSRSDDSDRFVQKADAMVGALPTFIAEANALAAAIPEAAMAVNYNSTSASPVAIGTGSKTFAIPAGGLFQIGQFVIAASAAAPANYMAGQVTSHDSATGTLTVNVTSTGGAGTKADWVIAVTVADALTPVATIAISGSGADLVDGSVPLSKIANISGLRLLGRSAATAGAPQEVSLGAGLSFNAGVLSVSSGTATLADGAYGDVTVSGGGSVMSIGDGRVTYAKLQNAAANVLLGSAAGGVIVEITCTAAGRAVIAAADAAAQRLALGIGSIGTFDEAAVGQIRANTPGKALSTNGIWGAAALVALAQAATITVNMGAGFNFTTTMTGNRTLGNPTNAKPGQCGVIEIVQDTSGGRTLAFAANWKFAGRTAPALSTAANTRDLLFYQVISANLIYANLARDVG